MCNYNGEYGEHPMDKYDTQAYEAEIYRLCDFCLEEIQAGVEAWINEDDDKIVCDAGCLAFFTSKYDVDIDDFEWKICGE